MALSYLHFWLHDPPAQSLGTLQQREPGLGMKWLVCLKSCLFCLKLAPFGSKLMTAASSGKKLFGAPLWGRKPLIEGPCWTCECVLVTLGAWLPQCPMLTLRCASPSSKGSSLLVHTHHVCVLDCRQARSAWTSLKRHGALHGP